MPVATLAAKPPSRRMLERTGMTPEQELELLIREQQKDDTYFIDRHTGEISIDAPAPDGYGTMADLLGVGEDGAVFIGDCRHAERGGPSVRLGFQGLADPQQIPHGTLGGYTNHRCRCKPCRQANTEYRRKKRAEKRGES